MAKSSACAESPSIPVLREELMREVTREFGLPPGAMFRRLADLLFWAPTRKFAQLGAWFDDQVVDAGFVNAACRALPIFVQSYSTANATLIPPEGPLLVAANHPGTYDSLLVAACLQRHDLKIVANPFPFLQQLGAVHDHMIFVGREPTSRAGSLRQAIRHLESGGAVLIFPSGRIDPDPAVLPGAPQFLQEWSPSLDLMIRRVPDVQVLVTIVSGVLSNACVNSQLARRKADRRQVVAEFIQVMQQVLFGRTFQLTPQVSFATPATGHELQAESASWRTLDTIVARATAQLLEHLALPQSAWEPAAVAHPI